MWCVSISAAAKKKWRYWRRAVNINRNNHHYNCNCNRRHQQSISSFDVAFSDSIDRAKFSQTSDDIYRKCATHRNRRRKKMAEGKKCNTRVTDLTKSMSECSELCIVKCGPWALSMYAFGMAKQPLRNMTAIAHWTLLSVVCNDVLYQFHWGTTKPLYILSTVACAVFLPS